MPRTLTHVRGLVIDLDGTTYLGDRLIDGAERFFASLTASGVRHVFVTNNSSASGASYERKLRRFGLPVEDGQVLTSGEATAMLLRRRGYRSAFVLGTPDLEAEMTRAGFTHDEDGPDCVVLGFDRTLTYGKLVTATRLIRRGVPFIATHPDIVCPTEDGYIPDCGAMIALLQTATGVAPTVVGKPEPSLVEMALAKLGLDAPHVAVVGDRLYTDVAMARRSGTTSVLVLSGETTPDLLADATERPDVVVDRLVDLLPLLGLGGRDALAESQAAGGQRR